jgi:hypothetical protein
MRALGPDGIGNTVDSLPRNHFSRHRRLLGVDDDIDGLCRRRRRQLSSRLLLRIVTYNPDAGLWALTSLQWSPTTGGQWGFRQVGHLAAARRKED